MNNLLTKAIDHDKFSIAQLISLFEDERPESAAQRAEVIAQLSHADRQHRGVFLGITGTPGAGKSTLIGEIATRLVAAHDNTSVAVVAIDPASEISGGSLLGDRTRIRFPVDDKRLFFRSQSSAHELGGISPHTFQVCRLLHYIFDYVIIETVGIGQNEIEIKNLADQVYLILQPMAGDQIQFMKAGIMEIPDLFIINKCDEADAAKKSYHALKSSLGFVRPDENNIDILQTSAISGLGLEELVERVSQVPQGTLTSIQDKEAHFFEKWVEEEYGRWGSKTLIQELHGAHEFLKLNPSFDEAQERFQKILFS